MAVNCDPELQPTGAVGVGLDARFSSVNREAWLILLPPTV